MSSEDLFRFVGGEGVAEVEDRLCTLVMTRLELLLPEPEVGIDTTASCSLDMLIYYWVYTR